MMLGPGRALERRAGVGCQLPNQPSRAELGCVGGIFGSFRIYSRWKRFLSCNLRHVFAGSNLSRRALFVLPKVGHGVQEQFLACMRGSAERNSVRVAWSTDRLAGPRG